MPYTYDQILAVDPNNPSMVAANAAITIFNPNDAGKAPIALTDVNGTALPNPITVNRNGFGPAFQHPTLDRVGWHGGGFTGYFTSYEGMKAEAVSARTAAQQAAGNAGAAAVADLETRIAAGQFKGDKGADGSNVLPTDTAIKQAIENTGSATRGVLNATYEPKGAAATAAAAAAAPKLERSQRGWEEIRSQNYKALIPWYAALGNRDTTPAKIIWLGDSVTEGLGASTRPGTKRYVDRVLARIRAQYPTTGIGAGGGAGYYPTQYAGGTALANVTYGGTTTADLTASGLGLRSRILDSTDDYVQWTGLQGTSVDLLYQKKGSTAVLGWSVDGGAVTNLETMGSGGADTGTLRIPLGASGAHTVKVQYVSGGAVQPEGVYVYDGDEAKGIHIYEAGHHSYKTSNFVPSGNDSPIIRMASVNANLLVIAFGENEFLHNVPSATLRTNLVSLVTKLKSYTNPDPAIMFVINMEAKYATPLEPWANYVTAIYAAAADTGSAVTDMSQRMPAIGTPDAVTLALYSDDYHLNDKGNAMFVEPLVEALSPR